MFLLTWCSLFLCNNLTMHSARTGSLEVLMLVCAVQTQKRIMITIVIITITSKRNNIIYYPLFRQMSPKWIHRSSRPRFLFRPAPLFHPRSIPILIYLDSFDRYLAEQWRFPLTSDQRFSPMFFELFPFPVPSK